MEESLSGLKYEEEWNKLCQFDFELKFLREISMDGGLRASRFRSVIWKLFLGALTPGSSSKWPAESIASREHYLNLKKSLEISPRSGSEPVSDNPLSQHDNSTWHQYFCDKELRCVIHQDVIRTFPGVDFFKCDKIQETMINILFYYARENPTMCYRQGMHEILAPVIFVIHCDHQALLHTKENSSVREEISIVVDPNHLEEDSYTLFRRIMNAIEGSYLISNLAPTSTGYFPKSPKMANSNENQVISQLNWIKERLLAPTDPELHSHLENLDIPLPLFGIRWLRLLFGREFPLHDLLVLWDAIFAEDNSFDLVNYIVVAMLVAIRHSLLQADYTSCLTMLMRYPPNGDVSCIIEYALHLKTPSLYKIPEKLVFQKKDPSKNNYMIANNHVNYRHPPKIYAGVPRNYISRRDSGKEIIDGFTLDDPEVLLKELRHAQSVMALCRIKLLQYHQILEKSVPSNNFQAHQALTGIHELSSLLADTLRKPQRPQSVDPAYEVSEKLILSPSSKPTSPDVKPKPPQVDMTVFNKTVTPFTDTEQEDMNRMWKSIKM